jgi:protein O-mannosyl-transferase
LTKKATKKNTKLKNHQLKNNNKKSFLASYSIPISIFLVAVFGILLYSNTFHAPFYYDDYDSILGNPKIKNLSNFFRIPSIMDGAHERFISSLSFALNFRWGNVDVTGYHIMNIGIHIVNSVLVMLIIFSLFKTPALKEKYSHSFQLIIIPIAGLIFVSHPVQIQAVTYIIQRMTSLSTMFYLFSVYLFIITRIFIENNRTILKRNNLLIKISVLSLLLLASAIMGLWSKQIVASLPVMLLVCEYIFFRPQAKFNWKIALPSIIVFVLIVALIIKLNLLPAETEDISRSNYFLTQLSVVINYLKVLILPLNLNLDYEYPLTTTFFDIKTILYLIVIIALFFLAFLLIRKQPLISFSIFWYFIALSVESTIIPIRDLMVEHRLYLPMFSYALLIANVAFLFKPFSRKILLFVILVMFFTNSILAYQRNELWNDPIALWTDTIEKSPHKIRPQFFRGFMFMHNNQIDNAITDFKDVVLRDSTYYRAYDNLGVAFQDKNDYQTAIKYHDKAIKFEPNSPYAYNNRASAYIFLGKYDEALNDLEKAIHISKDYADAYYNFGYIYFAKMQFQDAIKYFSIALELDPSSSEIYNYLAYSYSELGNTGRARDIINTMISKGITPNPGLLKKLKY